MRTELKPPKPLPPTSARVQLSKFEEWGADRAIKALQHTTVNSWIGIREPEGETGNRRNGYIGNGHSNHVRSAVAAAGREDNLTDIDSKFERLPPHDLAAERALLGSLIIASGDMATFATTCTIVGRDDFYGCDNQELFTVLVDMQRQNKPIDAITVRAQLESRGILEEVGGVGYLGNVLHSMPSAGNFEHYARIVKETSILRGAIAAGSWIMNQGWSKAASLDANEVIGAGIGKLSKLIAGGASTAYRPIGDIMLDVFDQAERGAVPMVPTGLRSLDDVVGGIGRGEMVVIAGRPSMGKSLLGKQIAVQVARAGIPVGIVSLEEGQLKIGRNLLSSEAGIDNRRLRSGEIHGDEWVKLQNGVAKFGSLPLYVADKARRMTDIRAIIATWVARHGVQLIVLDYMQRIRGVAGSSAYETASAISLELSDLTKDTGVAMIALAQLNRGVEHREDKRPTMADLRDSGQIEQDADGIVFLHREDYYHLDEPGWTPTGDAELIIAKWRDGVRGKIVKLKSSLKHQPVYRPGILRSRAGFGGPVTLIVLKLRAEGPGPPGSVRLRRWLKQSLRCHGLRCTSVELEQEKARQRPRMQRKT